MEKQCDIFGLGNALLDCEFEVDDSFLEKNDLVKGRMTLVDAGTQAHLIAMLKDHEPYLSSGGSVANAIVTASELGCSTAFGGLVGDDEYGDFYMNELHDYHVFTANGLFSEEDTGKSLILVTSDAQRTMLTCLGASQQFGVQHVSEGQVMHSKYLYIEGYLMASPSSFEALSHSVDIARQYSTKIAVTLSDVSMIDFFRTEFNEIFSAKVDVLFCNEAEALAWAETSDLVAAAEIFAQISRLTYITLGRQGHAVVDHEGKLTFCPLEKSDFEVECINTTGAGDVFSGVVLYGVTQGIPLHQISILANRAATQIVCRDGARLPKDVVINLKADLT